MHSTVMDWLAQLKFNHPSLFAAGSRVLEYGSRDINGSPRRLFPAPSYYLGIDAYAGAGVDVVGIAHEHPPEGGPVDVVVSTEMLEHDPYWEETLRAAAQHLRPGGLLAFTCASRLRPEHHLEDSPTPGYYGGRDPDEMLAVLSAACQWRQLDGGLARQGLDTMVWGIKA